MPCDAIATARARVESERLAELLTDELVSVVAHQFLKLFNNKQFHTVTDQKAFGEGVIFKVMDDDATYTVSIYRAKVKVTGDYNADGDTCRALAESMTGFLTKTAGLLFQRKVSQVVSNRFQVTNAQQAPNGALVLSVEI